MTSDTLLGWTINCDWARSSHWTINCHWARSSHWTINCHWARSFHSCEGTRSHWNIRNFLPNDEALYLWPVSMHSAQYTPVSRHTRYSILACCTGLTSFLEPSSSSSPGHTKNCIRFLVCTNKVYRSTSASPEPTRPTTFSYPHSLHPYLTLPVIISNHPGMVVCVEKFSGNSLLDSMSVSLFCTHAVMSLHGSGGRISFSLHLWFGLPTTLIGFNL